MSHQLRDDIDVLVVFAEVDNTYNMRMLKFIQCLKFLFHQIRVDLMFLQFFLAYGFNRARDVCLVVLSFVHCAESTFAKLLLPRVQSSKLFNFAEGPKVLEIELSHISS